MGIGGGEFVSLHPGLEAAEVPELIERIRSASGVRITPELPLAEALRQADAATYDNTHSGG